MSSSLGCGLPFPEQGDGGHDHAGRAVAALRGLLVDESLLHGVEAAVRGQAFQRHDLPAAALSTEILHEGRACPSIRTLRSRIALGRRPG